MTILTNGIFEAFELNSGRIAKNMKERRLQNEKDYKMKVRENKERD